MKSKRRLKDREAKALLLQWPRASTKLWPPPGGRGAWIRAQPNDGKAPGPTLSAPGASLYATQPDGLWVHFNGADSCDVVAIEVCGTIQNLNDKRSRYMPASHSIVLKVSRRWALEEMPTRGRAVLRARFAIAETLGDPAEFSADAITVPVRHLRVLYALKNDDYIKWTPDHAPTGYEYFIPHSSLGSYNSPKMQEFLRRMSSASQFYSLAKDVK